MTVQVCPTAEKDSMKIESFLFVKQTFMDPIPYRYTLGSRMTTSKKNHLFLPDTFPKSKFYTIFVSFR